eukprot:2020873-Amphidinium_carterae.3
MFFAVGPTRSRRQQLGGANARCVVEVVLQRCFVCDALFWIGGKVGIVEGATDGGQVVAREWKGEGEDLRPRRPGGA